MNIKFLNLDDDDIFTLWLISLTVFWLLPQRLGDQLGSVSLNLAINNDEDGQEHSSDDSAPSQPFD